MKRIILSMMMCLITALASAETIRIVVPFAPGGAADQVARVLEKTLSAQTQHNYTIEYRAGAGGAIGAGHVAKNRGPETVLLIHSLSVVVNSLQSDAVYSLADFEPVVTLGSVQLALITNSKSTVNTMPKLLSTKDPVFFGSAGIGAATHVAGEIFGNATGVDMIHVPYKGEASPLADIIGNNITVMFASVGVIKDQPVTVLAVTGTKRSKAFSKVPTLQESGVKGFETSPNWLVLLANSTADPRILAVVRTALGTALRDDPELFGRAGLDTDRSQLYNTQQFLKSEQQRMRGLLDKIRLDNK